MKKQTTHPLLTGTLILTSAGLLTRLIGFFYRIFLSRLFGEEGMGIYQLLGPVLSISFSLTAAGYQNAISKLVAEQSALEKKTTFRPLVAALSITFPLSLFCNAILFFFSEFIGVNLLLEPRTAPLLRILSFSIPLSTIHSCINGYFYGTKKTGVPAISQLIEQLSRVACVYLLSTYAITHGHSPSIVTAVWGLTTGEFIATFLSILLIFRTFASEGENYSSSFYPKHRFLIFSKGKHLKIVQQLFFIAFPLSANRIVLNLLQSVETVSIPAKLKLYGYDATTALSIYGVLTGMALPFIFFPNTLTGSVAVILLPLISEKYALGDISTVKKATKKTICYSILLGFGCLIFFVLFGNLIGSKIFGSSLAGYFITTLGFICPFLYLDTTLSSILQGIGKVSQLFVMNVLSLLLRLLFVLLLSLDTESKVIYGEC